MNLPLIRVTLQNNLFKKDYTKPELETKMAYKKYIKRGGKVYGPYIYHSRRIGGKVISEYRGQEKLSYKKIFLAVFGVIFLAAFISILIFSEKEMTGEAVFDLDADYRQGKSLEGKLRLSLQEGELIPASSKLVFENNGNIFEYDLKDLVSEELNEGSFYIKGASMSGSGEGYGISGGKEISPTVYFSLSILSDEEPDAEQTDETETTETQIENTTEETEEAPITGNVISNFFLGLGMTGNAVVEFEREINGQISAGETFTYTLQEGERIELKPRSVKTDSKQLSDNDVELKIEGNEVIVTTDYSEIEKGFGEDYLGSKSKELVIDISSLDLILGQGNLKINLIDSDENVISLETSLEEGKIDANEIILDEPILDEPTLEVPETDEVDYEIEETDYEIETEIYVPELVVSLTEQERAILIQEFGNASVKVKEAQPKRGFINIRYELGEIWSESNHDANLSREILESFIDRDIVKWLKDIAKSLLEEPETETELEEWNYPILQN